MFLASCTLKMHQSLKKMLLHTWRICEKWGQEQLSPKRYQGNRVQVHFICGMTVNLSVSVLWDLLFIYLPSESNCALFTQPGPLSWCSQGWLVLRANEAKVKGLRPS